MRGLTNLHRFAESENGVFTFVYTSVSDVPEGQPEIAQRLKGWVIFGHHFGMMNASSHQFPFIRACNGLFVLLCLAKRERVANWGNYALEPDQEFHFIVLLAKNGFWARVRVGQEPTARFEHHNLLSENRMLRNFTRLTVIQWKVLLLIGMGTMITVGSVRAQGFVWAKQVGSAGSMLPPPPYNLPTVPSKIAVDDAGSVYITGSFLGTAQFGATNLTSAGDADLFLAKYDNAGNLQWAWQAGGVGRDHSSDVAVDLAGNIYITGTFQGTASFGSTNLTTADKNLFLAKLDSDGTLIWVRGGISGGEGFGIAVDSAGNTYCTGNVGLSIIIEKRDPSGNVQWYKELPGEPNYNFPNRGNSVKVDSAGNVFVVGQFATTIHFGATILSNYYFQAVFLTKLNASGDFLWARKAGAGVGHAGMSLALDSGGSPIITGPFTQTIDFGSTNLTTQSGGTDGFLAKYDSVGNVLWVQRISKGLHDTSCSVATDTNDNVYVSGYVSITQVFVHKYDVHGNLFWEIYPAKTGSSISYGVAARRPGHAYLVTTCTGDISFDDLAFTNLLGGDIFVSEISEQVPPVFTLQPTSSPPGFLGGSNYSFTTAVRSVFPVSYQWEFNGTNLPGATNASLTITNAQIPAQGSYRVIATNLFGAATSAVASLTVYYTVVVLTNGSGTVSAIPTWQQSYAANSSLTLTANPGTNAPFTEWTGEVTSQANPLSLVVTNHLLLFAWFADSVTNLVLDDLDPRVTFTGSWNVQKALGMYEASYRTAPCDSNASATAVFRPNIIVPGYYDVSIWYRSSPLNSRRAPCSIITDGSVITTNVDQAILGSRWVLIAPGTYFAAGTNGFITLSNNTGESPGSTVVADAVRLLPSTAPSITSGPQDQTAPAGSALTLRVFAIGTPPLAYQWQFNGTNLADGTRSSLIIGPLRLSDAGMYRVLVSNVLGQTPSSNAVLQVTPPPPSQLYAVLLNSNQQLHLTITSVPGIKLSVQGSSNLWDWIPVATLTNTTGTIFVFDPINPNAAALFYRAQWVTE